MMKQFLLILLLLSTSIGWAQNQLNQTDSQGQKQGLWIKKSSTGKKIYEGYFKDDRPIGEFKRYHSSGILKARLHYQEASDTIAAELFDSLGKLIAKGNYLSQLKIGEWSYFKKGQLVASEQFQNNQKHGLSKTYYPTGELFEEINWKYNQKNGIYRAFFKNGKPYLECQMVNDQRDGVCKVYHENGQLELDALYKRGLRNGDWRYYHANGDYSHTLIYNMGELINQQVLDSIQNIQFKAIEQNKNKLVDPESFMNDPVQYMQKNNMLRR
ncbi:toxin-antitoxin system YwqK family antitoxin [Sunxiuqinia elliptica]|uniref:Antitoxin component YwqK of YwqJK toxin-antitoxin module n=1 Tax=Sunxiuqinia elliptica TaxID=655355 RepID=A0A4R6H6W4_9BACT|nr:toxin-antitoxin system YwqK family antitoxin [Sunxiuqinia elliptica]TDO03205.1 antitoxin component YwqK of YwqJK toxin-antitoxin module [Sunxiuqinia elliptica]TDO59402.1 antitoxin component YwqK of YwqJK toxin-antitoxin module [Sunxiuqinia elliptica]